MANIAEDFGQISGSKVRKGKTRDIGMNDAEFEQFSKEMREKAKAAKNG